jgi:RHS repeat-associated protein
VLQNDTDPQDDALTATRLSDPTRGTIDSFNADGSFSYTPGEPPGITIGLVQKCRSDLGTNVEAGTLAAADVDQDGAVELVGFVPRGLSTNVIIVDPSDCSYEQFAIGDDLGQPEFATVPTLVNLDDDPELEVVSQYYRFNPAIPTFGNSDERLFATNLDGTPLDAWVATNGDNGLSGANSFDTGLNGANLLSGPVAVDLDGDGDTELVVGVTNAAFGNGVAGVTSHAVVAYDGPTGAVIWEYIGDFTSLINRSETPNIVDLDLDGDPEIIWSHHVLDHEGNLLFNLPVDAQAGLGGGKFFLSTAIANFDNDPFPEILGIDRLNIRLYSHDGQVQWEIPWDSTRSAGFPWSDITIAELDGDPFPEFVVMLTPDADFGITLYAFDTDGQELWNHGSQSLDLVVAQFGQTLSSSPVAIDLDRDGIDELIQIRGTTTNGVDDAGLYIFDGETGAILDFHQGQTQNDNDETLTVADIDGDGSAEIVTNINTEFGFDPIEIWDHLPGNPFPPAPRIRSGTRFQPSWVNEDGSIPASLAPFWLQPGQNGWNRLAPPLDPLNPESDSFTYRVSDGEFDSNIATVNIEIQPNGNPPFFLSEPVTGTSRGVTYEYDPFTVDVDPGDVVTYALVNGPAGMTIDPDTGSLRWYSEVAGDYPVSIVATDTLGLSSAQIFTVSVGDPVIVPDVVGSAEGSAEATLVAANLRKGSVFITSSPAVPAGQVISQSPPAGSATEFGSAVALTLSTGPAPLDRDDDGDGFSENDGDCDDGDNSIFPGAPDANNDGIDQDCDGLDGTKTLVAIEITPDSKRTVTGQPVPLTATGIFDDGTAQNLTAVASWTNGPTFSAGGAGNFTAEATFRGISGTADFTVLDRIDEDFAPLARIDSPGNGVALTAPTDVIGSVSDANLLRWELAYRYAGEADFIDFASGANSVSNAPIGEFDPTTLLNGLYDIRLRVYDRGGNVSEDSTTVQVEGQLKVGNFSLRYVDLELPLSGIPITLVRTYDSRDKRMGDFGVGWRLGVNSIEIRTNRELGSAWRVFRQGLTYGLVEEDLHIAAVRLPGGRIEAFEMVVGPDVSPIVPFPPFSQSVSFRPLPGTLGTLEALGENNISILDAQPGPVNLRLDSNGNIYNPTLFRYTTPDGTMIDLDTEDGIQRAETPAGQVLTFTPTSITHSNGTIVDIERDGAGRITRITDPAGFSQSYTYDGNGDLRAHNDQEDFVTRFDYDANHNVIRITDPLNRTVMRNDYDSAGRLIRATNANGDSISYTHDIDGRQEIATDPDGFTTVYDYDDDGNVLRITDALGGETTFTYDARGNRLSITNPAGDTTTYSYDSRENLLSITDAEGATTSYSYNDRDQLRETTDALGRTTRYEYDSVGRALAVVDAAGIESRRMSRDDEGNLVAVTDALGRVRRIEHDARGYSVATLDARGNRTGWTRNANGNVTARINPRGDVSGISVDGRGLPTTVSTPAGTAFDFGYNAVGELNALTDEEGSSSQRTVDAAGRITRYEDPDGNASQIFYDGRGNRIRVRDASGREVRHDYDGLGRQVRTTLPAGGVIERNFDPVGRMLTETDPNGNVTAYEYDAVGRNTAVVDALGQRTEFSYDLVGNLVSRLDARGNRTDYVYDVLDRLIETRYADGSSETVTYDAVGNVIAETDRLGRSKSYTYDPNDNLLTVTDIDGGVTTFAYDANNNRISQTDAKGHTTRMVYDANDRLIEKQYPDGSTERYEYDAGNRLVRTVLPDGKYIDTSHDGFGRPTGHDLNGEGTESFTYDGAGRLTQAVNLWGAVDYSYDADGRIVEIASEGGHAVRYAYDALGNRTSIATQLSGQAARTTSYTYDALNRLATIVEPDGDVTSYAYDPVGNVAAISYANGVVSSFSYDNVNQLTRIEHRRGATTLAAYDYTLDAGGRRLRVDHASGDSVTYSYDNADRLLQETHRNASNVVIFEQTFSYDEVGNRLTQRITGQAQTILAYDSADKLLTAGSTSFAYDANGRLVSRTAPQGTISYAYDVEGQLFRVTTPTGTVTYTYDANGKRRLRALNGSEQNFLLDEASLTGYDQALVVFDASDISLAEYHWGDRLISRDDGSDRFYHFDASRNTRLLTDEAGGISDRIDYDAFGNVRLRTGATDSPYGFAGEWQEGAEGLVFLRARFYDPETGRFISRDPFAGNVTDPVSLHRYLYANANPVMNTDPSGQATLVETMVISGLIAFDAALIVSYYNGETLREALPKAVIAGVFGAFSGALGQAAAAVVSSGASSLASVVASEVAVRWTLVTAHAMAQGFVNAIVGLAQLAYEKGEVGLLEAGESEATKGFWITFVAEFVTRGLWQPEWTRGFDLDADAAKAIKAAQKGGEEAGTDLFEAWMRSDAAQSPFEFLVAYSRSNGAQGPALAQAVLKNMDMMSAGAKEIILEDFVRVKVFSGPDYAEAFLESGKAAIGALWTEYQKHNAN